MRQSVDVHDDEDEGERDVGERHEGDDGGGDARDALEAAERDGGDERRDGEIRRPARHAEGDLYAVDDGVDLREGTDAEEGDEHAGAGKEDRHGTPRATETLLDVEHRAAGNVAMTVRRAVLDGEQPLGIFRRHAEERGHPHPEDCARAARLDRGRDADDVACTDGRGERDAQRLEARHVAFAVVLRTEDQGERERQVHDLQEAQAHGQEDARAHEQDDERRPPENRIDGIEKRNKIFHKIPPLSKDNSI